MSTYFGSVRENGFQCPAEDGINYKYPHVGFRFFVAHVQHPCNGHGQKSSIRQTFLSFVAGRGNPQQQEANGGSMGLAC